MVFRNFRSILEAQAIFTFLQHKLQLLKITAPPCQIFHFIRCLCNNLIQLLGFYCNRIKIIIAPIKLIIQKGLICPFLCTVSYTDIFLSLGFGKYLFRKIERIMFSLFKGQVWIYFQFLILPLLSHILTVEVSYFHLLSNE